MIPPDRRVVVTLQTAGGFESILDLYTGNVEPSETAGMSGVKESGAIQTRSGHFPA